MTADGSGSFDLKAFLSSAPIRWLITGGVFLIAAIAARRSWSEIFANAP
jgi:hypothetical protein